MKKKHSLLLIILLNIFIYDLKIVLASNNVDRLDMDLRFSLLEFDQFNKLNKFLNNELNTNLNLKKLNYIPCKLLNKSLTDKNLCRLDSKFIVTKIKVVENAVFVDDYFDTNSFQLLNSDSSLRYRLRYEEMVKPKSLFQYKTLTDDGSFIELKLPINNRIYNIKEVHNILNNPNMKNQNLIFNLKNNINVNGLKHIFSIFQNRNRFYLFNNENRVLFTISVDRVFYKKELYGKYRYIVEFEINEKLYSLSSNSEKRILKKLLNEIITIIKDKNNLKKMSQSKYKFGFDVLNIVRNKFSFSMDQILTLILFLTIFLLLIFYRKSQKLSP